MCIMEVNAFLKTPNENDLIKRLERQISRSMESLFPQSNNCLIRNYSEDEVDQALTYLTSKLGFNFVKLHYDDIIVLRKEKFIDGDGIVRVIRVCSEEEEWQFESDTAYQNFLNSLSDRFVIIYSLDRQRNNIGINEYAYYLLNTKKTLLLVLGMQGHYSSQYRRILLDFLCDKRNNGNIIPQFFEAMILLTPPFDRNDVFQIQVEDGKNQFGSIIKK